jgi:putative Holliday junction resolvase
VDSPKVEEFLGVDVGGARVGIARGNSVARLAEPLKTVAAERAIDELMRLSSEHSVIAVVVGRPLNLEGSETAQTDTIKHWVEAARAEIVLPFYWQDESLTSRKAETTAPHPAGSDAVAAAIFLQDFLDAPESDRVAI